ncbi:MAG: DUF4386 domain-containing protein [Thermoplasmata archaeon]|nr:DUF4386 domain-containing protein [Thermoplasmata archaeon]
MDSHRKAAMIVGVLFIIALVASLVGGPILTQSILGDSDYLDKISLNQDQVVLGVLFKFIGAAASAGIAVMLYPILRKHNEGLALGSVGFRLIEAVFYIVAALGILSLVSLSQDYASAGSPTASSYQILAASMHSVNIWAGFVLGVLSFCTGALMYYYVFYQSKLIPRWLSVWGLIAIALLLTMVLSIMFDEGPVKEPSGIRILLAVPIALQEMVLAAWLIVKGFDPSAIASVSANQT